MTREIRRSKPHLARRKRVRTARSYPYKLVVIRHLAATATASPAVPRSES
jgi:hypothetical protein